MSGPNAVVQNNIVYRILVQALAWNHRPTNMVTSNNLVFNISKPGQNNGHGMIIGVAENCCISNSVVQNNIFRDIFPSGQGQGVDCYSGTWANDFVRNNIMFATQGPATFGCAGGFSVSNNITANPQFVNYNANPSPPTIVNGLITWSDA